MNAKVIVMDEPTAALSSQEIKRLFRVARNLETQGATIVFVSHRLDEVLELTSRITVMRDGVTIGTTLTFETTEADILQMMVGREITDLFPKRTSEVGEVVLSVKELSSEGLFENISFEVRAGEIVGMAGLVRSGRSEIARAIFGIDKYSAGSVYLSGVPLHPHSPSKAIRAGVALVPGDRWLQGLFMTASIARNSFTTVLNCLRERFLVRSKAEVDLGGQWSTTLQPKFADINDPVKRLSSGKQPEIVFTRWLQKKPKSLIIDEPTQGIALGTKAQVHKFLNDEAYKSFAILMISSDLPEVIAMSDRILVVREGLLMKEFAYGEATSEKITAVTTGAVTV